MNQGSSEKMSSTPRNFVDEIVCPVPLEGGCRFLFVIMLVWVNCINPFYLSYTGLKIVTFFFSLDFFSD